MNLRKICASIILFTGILSGKAQTLPTILLSPPDKAKVHFETDVIQMGNIEEGNKVKVLYNFMNTGEVPLQISKVNASCDCTVAEFPHVPIAPGETGQIAVFYDSRHKSGPITQSISVVYNSDQSPALLRLEGTVIKPIKKTKH